MDPIYVIDCCGVFGYTMPWADWKAWHRPVLPTRLTDKPFVYLYSIKGQLGDAVLERSVIPQKTLPANCKFFMNVDSHIQNGGRVDWAAVFVEILANFDK